MNRFISVSVWSLCLFLLFVFEFFSINAQDTFKGIVPFVTTQAEVENKLGKPNGYGRYQFEDRRVYVFFRENECEKSNITCLCLAPIGTVAIVEVELDYDLRVEDLKLDPAQWEHVAEKGGHVLGISVYTNPKTGVTYQVMDGLVRAITYRASEETCKELTNGSASIVPRR
jgi:hypothetical protein